MKKTTVFLASSIGELHLDRLAISERTAELNDELIDVGERIHLFMCEHVDTAIALHGKQNEYNEYIKKPCDLFINLYHTKAGEYTVEEFDVALETRVKHGSPDIYVFWKESDQPQPVLCDFLTRAKTIRDVSVITYRTANELLQLFEAAAIKVISKENKPWKTRK